MLREVLFNDLYTAIIVVSLAIIATAKLINYKRFTDFLRLLGPSNYLRIYFKDHTFLDPFDVVLFLNFCINGTLRSKTGIGFFYIYKNSWFTWCGSTYQNSIRTRDWLFV
jgi:hypothetical protein